MPDKPIIIATVRGTREQRDLFKSYADAAGISLNAFMLASATAMIVPVNASALPDFDTDAEPLTLTSVIHVLSKNTVDAQ